MESKYTSPRSMAGAKTTRKTRKIILFFVAVWLFFFLFSSNKKSIRKLKVTSGKMVSKYWQGNSAAKWDYPDSYGHVAVLEGGGYHDEVILSFVAALSNNPDLVTDVYTWEARYGSAGILEDLTDKASGPVRLFESGQFVREHFDEQHRNAHIPDVIVAVTCRRDLLVKGGALDYLLYHTDATLWCVVHHSDKWEDKTSVHARLISSWRRRNRVKFLTLSPHVLKAMRTTSAYKGSDIEVFAPMFEPPKQYLPPIEDQNIIKQTGAKYLTLQGNFEPTRRNYTNTFKTFEEYFTSDPSMGDEHRLILLGHGEEPEIPPSLEGKVFIRSGLEYQEFYGLLQQSKLALTAFSHPKYLESAASSTVAAGVIVGIPIIADKNILSAYSYLREQDVIVRSTEEEEMIAAKRFLSLSPLQQSQVYANVVKTRNDIIEDNTRKTREWVDESVERRIANEKERAEKELERQALILAA